MLDDLNLSNKRNCLCTHQKHIQKKLVTGSHHPQQHLCMCEFDIIIIKKKEN